MFFIGEKPKADTPNGLKKRLSVHPGHTMGVYFKFLWKKWKFVSPITYTLRAGVLTVQSVSFQRLSRMGSRRPS